jgi:hypothetical protein
VTITFYTPDESEVREVASELTRQMTMDRIIFKYLPILRVQSTVITWRQRHLLTGMMQLRGINGDAPEITPVGDDEFTATPGYYAEAITLNERELLKLVGAGRTEGTVDLTEMMARNTEDLVGRRVTVQEYTAWKLLTEGAFMIAGQNGQVKHKMSFTLSTFNALVPWATHATATPLADLRETKLKFRGSSTVWDQKGGLLMNQVTVNDLLANTNANDLGGRRVTMGATSNSVEDINKILLGEGIPPITVVEDGYWSEDQQTFNLFVADGKFSAIGRRTDGAPIGYVAETIAAQNDYQPGDFTTVERDDKKTPPKVKTTHGFNGGPVLDFPLGVVAGDVAA